jgi:hypothetical protein
MDGMCGFVFQLASDRKSIRLRDSVCATELMFAIKADGTLGTQCEVAQGSVEFRSGAPIVMDDHPAVNDLIARARKTAEIVLKTG